MAENSKIEWTTHTFNPWIGCTKVSAGCANCYAENLMDTRLGQAEWGPGKPRKRTSEANWKKPLKWQREAEQTGRTIRVFCASLADVFDREVPHEWRDDLCKLIKQTPDLTWLLLTKRPENAFEMLVRCGWWDGVVWGTEDEADYINSLEGDEREEAILEAAMSSDVQLEIPENVWIGYSIASNKDTFQNKSYQALLSLPCNKFLSIEPLIAETNLHLKSFNSWSVFAPIKWAIVGGESGPGAREMEVSWARSIRSQCKQAGVAFFIKQLSQANTPDYKKFEKFPEDLQVRELPDFDRD